MIDAAALDATMRTGSKAFFNGNSQPGATVTGAIIDVDIKQITDYITKQPSTFEDGTPKQQYIVTLQTELRESGEDDGVRNVYIKTWGAQKNALRQAMQDAGFKKLSEAFKPGNKLTATFVREEPVEKNPALRQKVYAYQIERGTTAQAGSLDATMTSPAAAVQQPAAPLAPAGNVSPAVAAAQAAAPAAQPAGLTQQQTDQVRALAAAGLTDDAILSALQAQSPDLDVTAFANTIDQIRNQ